MTRGTNGSRHLSSPYFTLLSALHVPDVEYLADPLLVTKGYSVGGVGTSELLGWFCVRYLIRRLEIPMGRWADRHRL